MNKILLFLTKFLKEETAFAHCDIPCGIYDPHNAQMATHTVLRMTSFLSDLKRQDETKAEHDVARVTRVKEKHGELVEDELGTLENDYFKEEHFKEYPKLKSLIEKGIKLSIKTRQNIDLDGSKELVETVMEVAEIFFKTKGVTPVRVKSIYPTEGEIVTHK